MLAAYVITAAASTAFTPSTSLSRPSLTMMRAPALVTMGAKKSRYADDGTRESGLALSDGISEKILSSPLSGLFKGFEWGTEVEVGDPKTKEANKQKKKGGKIFGDGTGSDRGLGGNNAYRNTESARLGNVDEGQRIRKQRLEEYINSDEAPADPMFGKIISGSLILTLIALLCGVVAYYGLDGLIAVGNGRSG